MQVAFAPAADTAAPADGKKRGARGVKKASREEASDAVKALAAGSGWADAFVYDGAAQLFSTRDDLGAEGQEVEVGSGASQQRFKVCREGGAGCEWRAVKGVHGGWCRVQGWVVQRREGGHVAPAGGQRWQVDGGRREGYCAHKATPVAAQILRLQLVMTYGFNVGP